MFTEKILVLEATTGTFEGNVWAKIKARSASIADNRILSYKVDAKKVGDVKQFVDKTVEATFDVVIGSNESAILKIVGLSE